MEPALPEETVTKNDVQKASSERVGPMDDVLDSEVPVEIVQKQSLLRKRLPAKTADAGTMEEIALAALEMKSHMEGEIQRLRLENEAMRHESLTGRRAAARRPDPQGALSPTPPVPPPAKSPFKSPPFASPEARSAGKPRREASSPVVEELASLRRRNAELQRELQKSERAWQTPTATSRRQTPAHVLLETRGDGGRDVLAVLLDAAGDDVLEARDDGGDVVLHVAARVGALRCAQLLLQTACDPSPKNHDGLTPGDVARSKRDAAIANLIDEYGFDGEPTDFSAADDAPAPPLELFATAEGDEWQKLFCHDNQHPYYEHIASGHTQWEDPRADDGDGDGAALPLLLGAEAPETEEPEEDPPTSNRSAVASPLPALDAPDPPPSPLPALAAPKPPKRLDGAPARKPLMSITNA